MSTSNLTEEAQAKFARDALEAKLSAVVLKHLMFVDEDELAIAANQVPYDFVHTALELAVRKLRGR